MELRELELELCKLYKLYVENEFIGMDCSCQMMKDLNDEIMDVLAKINALNNEN